MPVMPEKAGMRRRRTSSVRPRHDHARGKIHPVKHMISDLLWGMRGLAIIIIAVVALSAMARGHQPHFVPRPTGPMPAVNVP